MRFSFRVGLAAAACAVTLAGCFGGGGGGGGPASSDSGLSGTAAVGAPLPSATITLKDANGNTLTATADANGKFTFPSLSGVTAPFMLQATGTVAGTTFNLYSLATASGSTLNVTPATDAITAQALGEDPSTAFASSSKIRAADPAKLEAAKTRLAAALAQVYTALGLTPADLMTTPFEANSTGVDKLLDVVSFDVQMQADKPVVLLTNKVAGTGVAIDPDSSSPAALPASSSQLSLDVAGINTLIANFNALMASSGSYSASGMQALFSPSFLEEGMSRADIVTELASYPGFQYKNFVLRSCDTANTPNTCEVIIGYREPDGREGSDPMVVSFENGKWVFYGDQSPFDYSVNVVAAARFTVGASGTSTRNSLVGGANLDISKGILGSSFPDPSATLEISTDGGQTWNSTYTQRFKANKAGCSVNYLSIETGTDCGNFFQIVDSVAAQFNEAQLAGKLYTRVRLFSDNNYTTQVHEHVAKVTTRLFTADTANAALSRSGIAVTGVADGFRSFSFTGIGLEFLGVDVLAGMSTQHWEWQDGVNLFNGTVTMDHAIAKCSESISPSYCSSTYSTARFGSMILVSRNSQNQGIWAFHAFQP